MNKTNLFKIISKREMLLIFILKILDIVQKNVLLRFKPSYTYIFSYHVLKQNV